MAQNNGFVSEECEINEKKSVETGDVAISFDDLKQNKVREVTEKDFAGNSKNFLAVGLAKFWNCYEEFISNNGRVLKRLSVLLLLILLVIYIAAVYRQFQISGQEEIDWCHGYGMAVIVLALSAYTVAYYFVIVPFFLPCISTCLQTKLVMSFWRRARYVVALVFALLIAAFLVWDTSSDRRRLISVGGLFTFVACGFIFSKHPTRVKWRTVLAGLTIQFIMGLLAIRWSGGRQVLKCVGNLTETFLEYSYSGAAVVYGDFLVNQQAVFAFQSLSAVFFVSMIVQVLFYIGWMQVFCLKLGWLIQVALGTTVMESVNAVSSVFLGMTEAPLLYKPYIKDLTQSEIHAVMVGGFSTIAGTVFAAYTSFGVDPAHIVTASIMTAPAALCFSKLVYPEDTQSKTDSRNVQFYKSEDKSAMDAAIQGAMIGTSIVLGIIAGVIAFVSVVAFFNGLLAWLGSLAGIENFTLETILAYLLFPVVWLLGVEPSQCLLISRLIGVKLSVNEFVAYQRFGELKKTGVLTARTEAITTYALCSFANPGSIGILTSTLTTLCPAQRFTIITVVTRAFCASVVVSFLTASIAGALMPEDGFSS